MSGRTMAPGGEACDGLHVHPVENHSEVSPPYWPPTGLALAVRRLYNELIAHVRRVHRLAVNVLTIHPAREVTHGQGAADSSTERAATNTKGNRLSQQCCEYKTSSDCQPFGLPLSTPKRGPCLDQKHAPPNDVQPPCRNFWMTGSACDYKTAFTWLTWKPVYAGGLIVPIREGRQSGRPGDNYTVRYFEAGPCRRPYWIPLGSPTMREAH